MVGSIKGSVNEKMITQVETEEEWKGFEKTQVGTYIPKSFDFLYKHLINSEMYKKLEGADKNQAILKEQEVKSLIVERSKFAPQDYPKDALLSPFHLYHKDYAYVNSILFIPQKCSIKRQPVI